MELERRIICQEGNNCDVQQCKNLHPKDKQFSYHIIMEKAKYQIKCPLGKNCANANLCLDLHDGEILPILCQKQNCDKNQCHFIHDDHKFQSEKQEQKCNKIEEEQIRIEEANNFKNQGNKLFQDNKYYLAINAFTNAIQLNNANSIFYSNRALCYKKMRKWDHVYLDSKKALDIDANNLRAHYLTIISKVELMKIERNIDCLQILRQAYSDLEMIEKEAVIAQNLSLSNLVLEKQKVQQLLIIYSSSQLEYQLLQILQRSNFLEAEKQNLSIILWSKIENQSQEQEEEKSEYFICPLTFLEFENPILTKSGQTYERSALLQHFQQNGHTDPITREKLNNYLIPNVQISQAITKLNQIKKNLKRSKESIQFD